MGVSSVRLGASGEGATEPTAGLGYPAGSVSPFGSGGSDNCDAAHGRALAQSECAVCHSFEPGGGPRVGPDPFGVVQRDVAGESGFDYSSAPKAHHESAWSAGALEAFLKSPSTFAPGDGVSGDADFVLRSHNEERYGKNFIDPDLSIQDWGVTYDDLEPHYDKFEYVCGTSGRAGNLRGQLQSGGNPFEGSRLFRTCSCTGSAHFRRTPATTQTNTIAALSYRSADALKSKYLRSL